MFSANAGLFALLLAGLLYFALSLPLWRAKLSELNRPLLMAAWLVHGGGLLVSLGLPDQARFGFAQALAATVWVAISVILWEARKLDVRSLVRVLAPLAVMSCILVFAFPGKALPEQANRLAFIVHLLLGTAAYGVLLLAALYSLLLVSAQRALQGGDQPTQHAGPLRVIGDLPPLMSLERVLFSLITVGFVLLSLTLLSGFVFSNEIFGRALRFDHKTLFTLLAWLVFGVLLLGRWSRGWRGRTALKFTLGGYALLLLGYVGSRFVLEVVLSRATG